MVEGITHNRSINNAHVNTFAWATQTKMDSLAARFALHQVGSGVSRAFNVRVALRVFKEVSGNTLPH
eukprot:5771829-Amphidinium_carterae.1